ncbi:MAG: response regulator transcription factor [Blastocatellia bacterium]|nr:response regulator transcription factor [Chloracidobacterium sp.]MBL8185427.1 response regulator transcription factor [Blastocatellia bacterium]HBE83922.1 DNA-binding response regulator [Blastocatellia bacterium]HRJ89360.1 response regulator transcription factor [Pyrinomonadaceae bacterium]HRK48845.1 response regulator transcription factor [Pyrinomonadaceae bacterium]
MQQNILIIEDDADIAESLHYNFKREGFRSMIAESGEKGLRLALDDKNSPSLIILDLMLPGMSGMELCRRLRREQATENTPIIMLTAKAAETDKIAGLDTGADDYIVKPFSVKEVVARVRAVLRRAEKESPPRYEDERMSVDFDDMRVMADGEYVKLTRKEFALLEHLIKNSGRVATRQQLLDNVWGYSYFGDTRTLDVHIRRLRQKMGECGGCIETVVGVGYRFVGCK